MLSLNSKSKLKKNILSFQNSNNFFNFFLVAFLGFVLITFAIPVTCHAAVYYVATTGNDSNPGTQSQPWLTIQKAADTVVAGDTVIINSGTYAERVSLPSGKSGTSEAKIIFTADPLRSADMDGFVFHDNDYIRIEGLSIYFDGNYTSTGGGIWLDGDYCEIVNNYFHDVTGSAIQPSWGTGYSHDYAYVADNYMYKCNKGFVVDGTGWVVENNEVERLIYYNQDADYSRFFGNDNIIRNNYFHGTDMNEIGTSHVDGFQSYNNNNGTATNITIENNIVQGPVHEIAMLEGADGSHDNIVFRNNIFVNSLSWGIAAYGITSLKVYNNLFAYIDNSGIGFRPAKTGSGNGTTGEIKNNIFFNVGTEYWAEDPSTVDARNNLLYKSDGTIDSGQYPNDIVNQDPKFTSPASTGGDFHILPDSPAIDHALTLQGFNEDKDGNTRPSGQAWDIGAYEYMASTNSKDPPQSPANLRIEGQ